MSIEKRFSLDELVTKSADVYEHKAFAEPLMMILRKVQEISIHRPFHGRLDALKCCDHGHFRLNGSFERRIRTGSEFKCRSGKRVAPRAVQPFRHCSGLFTWDVIRRKPMKRLSHPAFGANRSDSFDPCSVFLREFFRR